MGPALGESMERVSVQNVEEEGLYAGIDPSASPQAPSACAVLSESGLVVATAELASDDDIVAWLRRWRGLRLVAVDGPLRLPGDAAPEEFFRPVNSFPPQRRSSELELARRGFGCFFVTPNTFAKRWIVRCFNLGRKLAACGFTVIEVYPYAARRRVLGTPRGTGKQKVHVRRGETLALQELGVKWAISTVPTHHQIDAVLCALTAFLHRRGWTESLGDPEDGAIVVPAEGVEWRKVLPGLWRKEDPDESGNSF